MNKTKLLLIIVVVILVGFFVHLYFENRNYYQAGERDSFNVEAGDTFIIKLDINGSIGYNNCFLKDIAVAKLIDKEYKPGLYARLGYDGSGGVMAYKFKAVKPGIDTIKVASCPIVFENRSCEDYNDKNTEPGNVFIVNISE